ncbi:MAG: S8 family serine peptidase [Acidobacteria bacterium]|nr:S8 family serine peptidase [Acidobacteriota bacterium]
MRRIIIYLFIGLMVTVGVWPAKGSQNQKVVDLSRYRNARFRPERVLVKYRGESRVRLMWLRPGENVLGKLEILANDSQVEYAEPDLIYTIDRTPNDQRQSELWGMQSIRASDAWNVTTGSEQVIIAITDTGIDYTHPDLIDNLWRNLGEVPGNGRDDDGNGYIDDYYGWNAIANNGNPMDDNNHGTHVAGTIGAVGDNNAGVAGVNWRVKLIALKFLGPDGSGSLSDALEAINYAIMMKQRGVNIVAINASWGGDGFSISLQDAVDRATAAGVLFVAAAGNEGTSQIQYPGGYSNALAVAALDSNDQTLASFSSYGSWVDVAAPGRSILSTIRGGQYASLSGTSMATPHVTGLAGLAASIANLSVSQLREAIRNGVRALPALQGKVEMGGTINAAETLRILGAQPPPTGPPPGGNQPPTVSLAVSSSSISAGTEVTITAQASDPDSDPLTYQWQTTAGQLRGQGSVVTLETTNITSPNGAPVQVGVQVLVSDGRGGQAQSRIFITVAPGAQPAKFTLQIAPTTASLQRGRALFLIQITRSAEYQTGGIKMEPVILNNADQIYTAIIWGRSRSGKSLPTATMYVSLLTANPTTSAYQIRVKGTDDSGGVTYSNTVTAAIP